MSPPLVTSADVPKVTLAEETLSAFTDVTLKAIDGATIVTLDTSVPVSPLLGSISQVPAVVGVLGKIP